MMPQSGACTGGTRCMDIAVALIPICHIFFLSGLAMSQSLHVAGHNDYNSPTTIWFLLCYYLIIGVTLTQQLI